MLMMDSFKSIVVGICLMLAGLIIQIKNYGIAIFLLKGSFDARTYDATVFFVRSMGFLLIATGIILILIEHTLVRVQALRQDDKKGWAKDIKDKRA